MSENNGLSREDLMEARNETLEKLLSLGLIPSNKIDSNAGVNKIFKGFNLSYQASSQKKELAKYFDDELIRDIRVLASEAGNDLKALVPGKNDPDVSDIEIKFSNPEDDEMFNNIVKNIYMELNDLKKDFKACYELSKFQDEVKYLSNGFNIEEVESNPEETEKFLDSCIKLLDLSESYAEKILQDDQKLGEDNNRLLNFLRKKWRNDEIDGFYQQTREGKEKIGFEKFQEELDELTKFLNIEKEISNELENKMNEIIKAKRKIKERKQLVRHKVSNVN